MSHTKTDTLIFLKEQFLEIYKIGYEGSERLVFPHQTTYHIGISNKAFYHQSLWEFFESLPIESSRTIIMISDEIVFSARFQKTNSVESEIKTFQKKVLTKFENPVFVQLESDQFVFLFAANSDFYLPIKKILEKIGWKIDSVVPSLLFDITYDFPKGEQNLLDILQDHEQLTNANFLTGESLSRFRNFKPRVNKLTGILLALVIVVLGSLGSIGYILLADKEKPATTEEKPIVQTPAPSPTPVYETKAELTISVLNGTGEKGLAARIKKQLTDKEFTTITTANTTSSDKTILRYSHTVSPEIKTEIIELLKVTFGEVEEVLAVEGTSDIEITTGNKK